MIKKLYISAIIFVFASAFFAEGWSIKRILNPGSLFFALSPKALCSSTGIISSTAPVKQYTTYGYRISCASGWDSLLVFAEGDGNLHIFEADDTSASELISYMLPFSPSSVFLAGDILAVRSPSGDLFYRIEGTGLKRVANLFLDGIDDLYRFGSENFCIARNGSQLIRFKISDDTLFVTDEFIEERLKFLISLNDTSYLGFSGRDGYIYYYTTSTDSMYRKVEIYDDRDFVYGERADTFIVLCTQNMAYINVIPGTREIDAVDSFSIDDSPRDILIYGDTIGVVTLNSMYKYSQGSVSRTIARRTAAGVEKYKEGFALITPDSAFYVKDGVISSVSQTANDIVYGNSLISRDSSMHVIAGDTVLDFSLPSMPMYAYSDSDTSYYIDRKGDIYKFGLFGGFSPVYVAHSDYPLYSFTASGGFVYGAAGYHGLLTISEASHYPLMQRYFDSFLKRIVEYDGKKYMIREGDWIIYSDSAAGEDSISAEKVSDIFIDDTSLIAVCSDRLLSLSPVQAQIPTGAEFYGGFKDFASNDTVALLMLEDGAVIELEAGYTYLKFDAKTEPAPRKKNEAEACFDICGRKTDYDAMRSGLYLRRKNGITEKFLIIK